MPRVTFTMDEVAILVAICSRIDPARFQTAAFRAVIEKCKAVAADDTTMLRVIGT